MKRRDFNRLALGIGLSPILANAQLVGRSEALAQEPRRGGMLEFDDLQHILITRVPALTGRYEFLSFRQADQGRAWLAGILDQVASVAQARDSIEREQRWISVAFTWQGLRALGVDETSVGDIPGRIPARHGGARRSPWRHRQEPARSMDWRPRQSGPARRSLFFLRAMLMSASAPRENTRRSWQRRRASKCFHHSIWTALRPSTTRTIISVIEIGSLNHKSKEVGWNRRPGRARP